MLRRDEDTVLAVNDSPDQLEVMRLLLGRSGYKVLTASGGSEGVRVARDEQPDLVISDVSMPGVSGIELCRLIRAEPELCLTPVLLVSAVRRDSESVVAGLAAGADDYLEAPYEPVRLVAKVARLIERSRAEAALRRSEEHWRALIENSSDIISIITPDGIIRYESPSITRVLGYDARARIDTVGFGFAHREDAKRVAEAFRGIVEGGGASLSVEYRARHRDGSWRELETVGRTFTDESGETLIVVNTRDVTERRRAEEELRRQKEILQKIFDHIPVMISFWDAEGRLLLVNREWERVFGWTFEEIRERNIDIIAELYPDPKVLETARAYLSGALAVGRDEWTDFSPKLRDGRAIDTTWATVSLSDGTKITIGRDITERKRSERTLWQSNAKLRALAARLQSVREEESIRIARELHDELGGTLTGLKMDVAWLDRRLPADSDESLRRKLRAMSGYIDEAVQRVRNLSADLRPSVLDDLGLAAAIEWQAREFQRRTEIECEIVSLADVKLGQEKATALFRIFQEILTNVARHSGARRVRVSLEDQDGELLLTVADDGRGIRDGEINDARSLGLLGMRERALVFGGRVRVSGSEGAGTTVTVSIPRE